MVSGIRVFFYNIRYQHVNSRQKRGLTTKDLQYFLLFFMNKQDQKLNHQVTLPVLLVNGI
jgi:hypothetical protein